MKLDHIFNNEHHDNDRGVKMNPNWKEHKIKANELLKQGAKGVAIGMALGSMAMCAMITTTDSNEQSWLMLLLPPILFGILMAGVPYGWDVITKLIGRWNLYGNILIILFLVCLKFAFSYFISVLVYPWVTAYHIINSQKTMKRVANGWVIFLVILLLPFTLALILAPFDDNTAQSTTNVTNHSYASTDVPSTTVVLPEEAKVTPEVIADDTVLLSNLCGIALDSILETEDEYRNVYEWTKQPHRWSLRILWNRYFKRMQRDYLQKQRSSLITNYMVQIMQQARKLPR